MAICADPLARMCWQPVPLDGMVCGKCTAAEQRGKKLAAKRDDKRKPGKPKR